MNHATEASCEDEQLLLCASQQYESNGEDLPLTAGSSRYRAPVSSTAIGKLIDSQVPVKTRKDTRWATNVWLRFENQLLHRTMRKYMTFCLAVTEPQVS